jgi:hypothetical protein
MKAIQVMAVLFGMGSGLVSMAADFNGDGTGEIAVFRASSGMWSVRGVTQLYLGSMGDIPVPGDYDGSGTDQVAIFRAASGLWAGGHGRVYFGSGSDEAMPGDYNGDGTYDVATFRGSSGLWAVRGITRVYFGNSTDAAIAPGKAARHGGLLKTGQTTVYWAGDDGTYQKGKSLNYTDNGNGTVTDKVTGLMWAKDYDGAGCNFGNQTDWYNAIGWANGLTFAGYPDWRLPNRRELESLVEVGRYNPSIHPPYFSASLDHYWSSTTYDISTAGAWYVEFRAGVVATEGKSDLCSVRAVRGGE